MNYEDSKLLKIVSGFVQFVIILIILWGEFGGIWHAFKHYGTDDGLLAVFVPPYSWYRGIEFFFWLGKHGEKKPSGRDREIQDETRYEQWPDLKVEEFSEMSEISAKAMIEPLTDEDLKRFRQVFDNYSKRVRRSLDKQEVDLFVYVNDVTNKYYKEVCKCIIQSVDLKQPFFSSEFERLYALVDTFGLAGNDKLKMDKQLIIAAGKNQAWVDPNGEIHPAPTREEALAGMKHYEMVEGNFKKLSSILKELVKEN